jgi:hypothetical protein
MKICFRFSSAAFSGASRDQTFPIMQGREKFFSYVAAA